MNGQPGMASSPSGDVRVSGGGKEGGARGLKRFPEVKAVGGRPEVADATTPAD